MDITKVLQAITLCVSAHNQAEIQNGQSYLESSALEAEYPLKLMMIVDRSDLEINIRQFAATELKNSIKKFWNPKKDKPRFSDSDKITVKSNLIDALIRSADNSKLCKMYCKIILDVCAYDFPKQWPNLVDEVVGKLAGSENPNVIFGCLLALQQVFDNLQFEMEDRSKLETIIPVVLPAFQKLISQLMGIYNADNAYILKPILKCFYMAINLELPACLQNQETLSQWINFFKLLLDSKMPDNLTTPTANEDVIIQRDKHPLWKNKKWAGRILTKFIMRYANQQITTDEKLKNIAQWLIDNHMAPIMHSFAQQLQLSQTLFVGNACIHFGVKFLIKTLRTQSLFDELKPYLETLLFDSLFPMLFLTPRDSELWNSDPAEFINDFINGGLRNNKNLVMDLIRGICSNTFSNNTYLHQFVQFCAAYLDGNANPRNNQALTLAIKDGIFFAFGQLKELILKDNVLKGQIEALLEKYILPEFQNPNPFIRSRTCWVFGRYGFVEFRNNQNVITAVQGITACMKDENLPVKFKAALALHSIISHKQAQDMVRSYLSEILRIYLKLMDEIDSEELVASLEGIVEEFQHDIGPYAYDLCVHLSSAFYKLRLKDNDADVDDDGECSLAAGGCLQAIGKILTSPISPEVLAKLEAVIVPILNTCLVDDQCDFMDETLHLLQQLVFKATQLAPSSQLWFYYPVLVYMVAGKDNVDLSLAKNLNEESRLLLESAVNGWAPEYINEIVIILKNFIQKGGEFFLSATDIFGVNFVELLFICVRRVYEKSSEGVFDDEESSMKNVLSVFYCLIENHLKDQKISGAILRGIIQHSLANLNLPKMKKDVLVANIETLCLCFYYNATETFQQLYSLCGAPIVQAIFERWFLLLGNFKSDFTKQRLLLAFTSIIACPNIPDEIRPILPIIVKHCVQITTDIVKLREEEDFQDVDEDDEDETADNAHATQNLSAHVKKLQENVQGTEGEHVEEDDDDDLDDDFDPLDKYLYNYSYDCPLENMDEIIFLEQNLLQIAQGNPQLYTVLTQQLSNEEKQALQQNIATSKKQYEEYLKSKQEGAN